MTFEELQSAIISASRRSTEANKTLKAIPGNASSPMGLTPDTVRARQDWQAAYTAVQDAMAVEKRLNTILTKQFAKEYRAWRRAGGRWFA